CWGTPQEPADPPCSSRLRRARRERPGDCGAAEKWDEAPPPHGAYPKAKDHGRSIAGRMKQSRRFRVVVAATKVGLVAPKLVPGHSSPLRKTGPGPVV